VGLCVIIITKGITIISMHLCKISQWEIKIQPIAVSVIPVFLLVQNFAYNVVKRLLMLCFVQVVEKNCRLMPSFVSNAVQNRTGNTMRFYWTFKYAGKQFGQYMIDRLLGEGRYGLCFLARSQNGNKVVIKKYKTSLRQKKPDCINEAVILSKLKDKRIPDFLGVINEKGFYGFVLEYKNGCTVKELLFKQNYKFTRKEVFYTGLQLINIMQYLHENGVVHRDIRISNVVIDQGKVYLIDFGLARRADNNQYRYALDFSYLGDLLLYLLYSSFEKKENNKQLPWTKELPWYEELLLTPAQILFLKKLLGLELVYENINNIEADFIRGFSVDL